MVAAGLALGTMYLAGHPQATLYLTFLLACLSVYEIAYRARHKSEPLDALTVVRMALPVVIALGIFAIQFLPAQELADLSRRDVITYQKSVEGSLSWGHLYTFVMPRLFGLSNAANDAKVPYWNGAYYNSWETAIYIGILPLFFALLAGVTSPKRKYVPFLAGMAAFAILFAMGDHFFLYKLFFNFPLFNRLRTPARMMMVFSFCATALSTVGLAAAMQTTEPRFGKTAGLTLRGLLVLPWLLAIVGAIHANTFVQGLPPEADQSISWAAGLAAFPLLAMLVITMLQYTGKLRGLALALPAIAVTVIELFMYGMSVNAGTEDPRVAFRQQPELISMLQQDQAKELSRARTREGNQMLVKRNQGAYDKLQLIEGYNPLVLQRVSPDMANQEGSADLMNIKWSISKQQAGGFGERTTYLPRVRMYYRTEVLPDEAARERLKQDAAFDYRNTMLLEEAPSAAIGVPDPAATSSIVKYAENEIQASVKTASNGMLFFSEVYYPAWKAYVDDKPVKLYRAFTSLRAVEVPAGTHTVTLRYESDAFRTGSLITIVTLVISVGALGALVVRDKKRVTVAHSSSDSITDRHEASNV
jgi:hypothetical protein